jgi:hypothetical protein
MRDTELDQIRKDVAAIKSDAEGALREVTRTVDTHITDAKLEVEKAAQAIEPPAPEHTTPEQAPTPLAASDTPAAIEPPAAIEASPLAPLEPVLPETTTSALNGAHAPTPAAAAAKVEGQPT